LLRLTRRLRTLPLDERDADSRRVAELLGADVKPVVVERTNSIGMRFALVPAGRFLMGSPLDEADRISSEQPHEVEITKPFWIGVFLVTQAQWAAVMGTNPSYFCKTGGGSRKVRGMDVTDFPVEMATWQEVQQFHKKLTALPAEKKARRKYRLPSEAEWEYACRAGGTVTAPYSLKKPSASLSSRQANFNGANPYGDEKKGPYLARTSRVGSFDANPLGLYDVHGNLWEWCSDWYDSGYYPNSPPRDPAGPRGGSERVIRGGGWFGSGSGCRSARRDWGATDYRYDGIGFRSVLLAGG
jgi:formylglycine-generating enzyme required for sulfatase activity